MKNCSAGLNLLRSPPGFSLQKESVCSSSSSTQATKEDSQPLNVLDVLLIRDYMLYAGSYSGTRKLFSNLRAAWMLRGRMHHMTVGAVSDGSACRGCLMAMTLEIKVERHHHRPPLLHCPAAVGKRVRYGGAEGMLPVPKEPSTPTTLAGFLEGIYQSHVDKEEKRIT